MTTRDPERRDFVSYIDKSREYYAVNKGDAPYRWAKHDDAPFTPLAKPLAECRVAVVTTTKANEEAKLRAFAAPVDPPPDAMFTDHLFWHKEATTTDDLGSFLPLERLSELAADGTIGSVGPRFFGAPTVYSQRRTQSNAEEIAAWCVEDEVDLVLLAPL